MSLIKFKVYWEEDADIFRDIEVMSGQTFYELHQCIRTNFQLPETMEASIFLCDERHIKGKEVSSVVEKNLRDAPALSMKRTPIGALMNDPHQKFIYVCDNDKGWHFIMEIITFKADHPDLHLFPRCMKSEGLSPSQFGLGMNTRKSVLEVEERYDLGSKDGYGDEGEDEGITDEQTEDSQDDNFTEDL